VTPGGGIELHAAFREESRTSLPSVSATRRKSGGATSPIVVFSQGKPFLATYEAPVIAKPLYEIDVNGDIRSYQLRLILFRTCRGKYVAAYPT
jgi:hypothetical protein